MIAKGERADVDWAGQKHYSETNRLVVVLVDEYDTPVTSNGVRHGYFS
jgi:hypothetical protein